MNHTFFQDLAGLGRGYTLDLFKVSLGSVGDSLDRVVASSHDQLDVTFGEATETLVHRHALLANDTARSAGEKQLGSSPRVRTVVLARQVRPCSRHQHHPRRRPVPHRTPPSRSFRGTKV